MVKQTSDEEEPKTFQCEACGAASTWEDGFVPDTNVRRGPHHRCITCYVYREKYHRYYRSWLGWALAALVVSFQFGGSIEHAIVLAVGGYGLLYAAVVYHELGHYFAARLLGIDVPLISFGGGLRSKVFKFGETFVSFSPSPSEGMIIPAYATAEHYRKKAFVVLLAGPLVNLLAAAVGAYLYFVVDLNETARLIVFLWTACNLYLGVVNLFIFREETSMGTVISDGAQLVGLHKESDEQIQEVIDQRKEVLALLEYSFGDPAHALRIIGDGALESDDLPTHVRTMVSAALVETNQVEEGIRLSRKYLTQPDLDDVSEAVLKNNLAYTLYLSGDAEAIAEADELSAASYEVLPMLLPVMSTRGAVLIARGKYEEGVELLSDKRFRLEAPVHRASVYANRALGLIKLGRTGLARKALNAARKLDPKNVLIPAVESELALAKS